MAIIVPYTSLLWSRSAILCAQQVDTLLLDYDEDSVITSYNQTSGSKKVYEGVEVPQRNRTPLD